MKRKISHLALDLGASSGRGIVGDFDGERLSLSEVHRFENIPYTDAVGSMRWDLGMLFDGCRQAISRASERDDRPTTLGIDTWGVDYGLLDSDGRLLGDPMHYRDPRCAGAPEYFSRLMPLPELYELTGIQSLDFNSVYQLAADRRDRPEVLSRARRALFIPDLLGYMLSGREACEYTIASTSALLDARTREFSPEILSALGLTREFFAPMVYPAEKLGRVLPEYAAYPLSLISVASHDTASAVLSVPAARGEDFLYISSGTWSLMGAELDAPIITPESRRLNCTNEGGFGGSIRFLKNIMGLWLLQESRRQWRREGQTLGFSELSAAAEHEPICRTLIAPDLKALSYAGDIPSRIREAAAASGEAIPEGVGATVRTIFDSLALCYRATAEKIASLCQKRFTAINIVGGGAKDAVLNQTVADATGMSVIAGPFEATSIGNISAALIASGELSDIWQAREVIRRSFETHIFEPRVERTAVYDDAYERFWRLTDKH